MKLKTLKGIKKKALSIVLSLSMVAGLATGFAVNPVTTEEYKAADYNLADNIQDGVILHCFDWKYNDIKAELPNIAAAGFTSVQTSPAQPSGSTGTQTWYWLYQPHGFRVATNPLGSKEDLQSLCTEAEKYGIKVIVDVVANHLAGDHNYIDSDMTNGEYWHSEFDVSNWADRYQVTHGKIGMPDINSEHSFVQQKVATYIDELKSLGVDGIRWDAAKHISLPSEGCNFWPAVTSQGLYHYGEILVGPDDRQSGNEGLMKEYTNYMSVTDSVYGATLRNAFAGGGVPDSFGNWAARGVSNNKLVYWSESHDTWSNGTEWGFSHGIDQNKIDRAYAIAASRSDITALYFSRPSSNQKDGIKAGQKGSTHFTSPEVAEVNKFHNAKVGETDYYTTGSNCAVVCRETGIVVAAGNGSNMQVSVPNGGGTAKAGTYIDAITGNKWTVTSSTASGTIGSTGIAVLYLEGTDVVTKTPSVTISKAGGSFTTETLTLTIGLKNATSGTYQIGSGDVKTFTSSTSITIGSDMAIGDSVTVKLTATDGTNTDSKSYTFKKVEQPDNVVYYQNTNNWSTVKAYYWSDSNKTMTTWPGVAMTSEGSGVFSVEVPEDATYIIFNDGGDQQTDDLTLQMGKLYNNGSWSDYSGGGNSGGGNTGGGGTVVTGNYIYYKNNSNWSSVTAYYWSDANKTMTSWPGVGMSSVGNGVYKIEVPADAQYIIFSNNGASQTDDLTIPSMGQIYNNGSWSAYSDDNGGGSTGGDISFTTYENGVYFQNTNNWSKVNIYYWSDSNKEMIGWPGTAMTSLGNNYYGFELDANTDIQYVIFNDGTNQTDDLNFTMNGLYNPNGLQSVVEVVKTGTVTVKYVDEAGKEIATSKTMSGTVGDAYTTSAATIDGYTLKTTPSNATGKYTASAITVTYVYAEVVNTDPTVTTSLASGSTFKTETQTITLTLKNAVSGTYSVDNGPVKEFTSTANVVLGQGKIADSTVTVVATATGSDGTTKTYTFTYNKEFNGTVNEVETVAAAVVVSAVASASSSKKLASQYSTNATGVGVKKTISIDGSLSDWDSSMLIAQGAANDDPRVYRDNSMYEIPIDLYALYAAYDDNNLYLMWEMTNVQDVVAPVDNYPLSQGVLFQTQELPFFILVDTKDASTAIGNNAQLTTGGTIWDSGMTVAQSFNKLISINTKGGNGPWVYGGDSSGLNKVEILDASTSKIDMGYGLGILNTSVKGINGAYGSYNGRVLGDMCNESADWVDFNTLGHSSSTMDFFYELSIPFSELGVTVSDVTNNGLGVLLVATMGKSGMDCLPYDLSMNDNADQADTQSQEFNSLEKSDEDFITTAFASVGKAGSTSGGGTTGGGTTGGETTVEDLELNFGADRSAPQMAGTALTLGAIAEGGKAPYTYNFYVNDKLVATESGDGEVSTAWTPSAGSYVIKCVVTDAEGTSVTSAKYYEVEGTVSEELSASLTVNGSTADLTKPVGSNITLNATANGGSGSYTYKFAVLNLETNVWTVLQNFNSNSSYTFALNYEGVKQFAVTVKDSNGTTVATNRINVTVEEENLPLSGALKVNGSTNGFTAALGTSFTLNAVATGGSGSYTYKFAVLNEETGVWTVLRDFSSNASYATSLKYEGVKQFAVTVKDSTGKTVATNRIRVTAVNEQEELAGALKINGSTDEFTAVLGTSFTLNATATGGSGSYTYKFAVLNEETGVWTVLRDFSSSSSYATSLKYEGVKQFAVTVKDSTGKTVAANRIRVIAVEESAELKGTLQVNGSTTSITTTAKSNVTLKVTATGGSGSYTYKIAVWDVEADEWTVIQYFNSRSSFTYALSTAGEKQFAVTVKDSTGATVATNRVTVNVVE